MGDNVQEIMEEMDDEEMIDDDDLFGDQIGQGDFDDLLEEFIEGDHKLNKKYNNKDEEREVDEFKNEEERKQIHLRVVALDIKHHDEAIDEDNEESEEEEDEEQEKKWDIETVQSTWTNTENIPGVIKMVRPRKEKAININNKLQIPTESLP